jgi:transcription initiation factor TFIIIB Brf1 subunit/transcription initiation factor TFIIB
MNKSRTVSKTTLEDVLEQAEMIFEKMDASEIIRTKSLNLLHDADKKNLLESCTPDGGAGAIYIACILKKLHVTQNFLSESSGSSPSSIRKHYMLLASGFGFYSK